MKHRNRKKRTSTVTVGGHPLTLPITDAPRTRAKMPLCPVHGCEEAPMVGCLECFNESERDCGGFP